METSQQLPLLRWWSYCYYLEFYQSEGQSYGFPCLGHSLPDEKENGEPPTTYAMKDFQECCLSLTLGDCISTGCRITWTNGHVWCKLDRVMTNGSWHASGLNYSADFSFPGHASDHSLAIVEITN
ncbi:hypothetical protein C2S51_000444 [Perilla frutescens var. frutescens]|nr:hypothetical protein C2S51_000444 [Perilla frutescens var. frutescens]